MTQEEARAVVQLGLEGADSRSVRVEDVAETLRMAPAEVEALLARVRSEGHIEAEMAEHRLRDMRRLLMALAFSVIVVGAGWWIAQSRQHTVPIPLHTGPRIFIQDSEGNQIDVGPRRQPDFVFER